MNQLPVLIIVLPLLIAPILLLVRDNRHVYNLSLGVSFLNILLILILFQDVYQNGNILYELGSWKAPIGIRLNADLLSCYFLLLINFMAFICLIAGNKTIKSQVEDDNIHLFYIAWLLCNVGFSGIVLTNDIFNLFVFLEISSLASYFLISQGNYKASSLAAIQYLFIGSIGAVFILFAIGILYVNTGTLNMTDLSNKIGSGSISLSMSLSIAMFLIGVGIKTALFPLHGWLIRTYSYAPSIIVSYFSGTSTKIGIYILLRVFLDIFNSINPLEYYNLAQLILFLSLIGVLLSTLYAIKQNEIKKMLAYSSVAQLSYIIIAIMLLTPDGLTASLIHVFNHSIIKTGLFLVVTILFINNKNVSIDDFSGLGEKYPLLMSAFVILLLGLIGLPLTSGFISKWYLISAILQSDYWYISGVILITSFMTFFYAWLLIEKIYFSARLNHDASVATNYQLLCVYFLAALTIYLGVDTSLTFGISEQISNNFYSSINQ